MKESSYTFCFDNCERERLKLTVELRGNNLMVNFSLDIYAQSVTLCVFVCVSW